VSALDNVRRAISALREARELLERAGATRAVERVRAALKSADGARRHAELREDRERVRDAARWTAAQEDSASREGAA
jgi:hypothetical protein